MKQPKQDKFGRALLIVLLIVIAMLVFIIGRVTA
jgi:preprotein translocase subunit SecE